VASGPPGVEIQILDGGYSRLHRGAESLKARLEEGLYIVRWLAQEGTLEEIVRVTADRRPHRVPYPAPAVQPPPGLEALTASRKGDRRHEAEIVVLEEGVPGLEPGGASKGLRLFNLDDVAMRSDRRSLDAERDEAGSSEAGGWALRVYGVAAGVYQLRFETSGGIALNQSVPALPGRRTIVRLRLAVEQVLTRQGDGSAIVSFRGVDPARTLMVTAPLGRAGGPARDMLQLAESMLDGIVRGEGGLSAAALKRISAPAADPLLKLYGAAAVLAALKGGRSPGLDEPCPEEPAQREAFLERWRGVADGLLASIEPFRDQIPDVAVLRSEQNGGEPQLAAPPLLARGWRPRDVEASSQALRGPAAGPAQAGPWLAWSAAAAKGGEVLADRGTITTTRPRMSTQLPPKSESVTFSAGESFWSRFDGLGGVGVVLAAVAIGVGYALPRLGLHAPLPDVTDGALQLQTVDQGLWLAAAAGIAGLVLLAGRMFVRWLSLRRARGDPPALSLPILNFDDPHKGRFGGASVRDGVALCADFHAGGSPWVEIDLTLEVGRDARVRGGDPVVFFLHDSFDPARVPHRVRHGRARLRITAYGGFTVGAWLPGQDLQLELDLAEAPGAPVQIREL
jgi:hypothetical protein